MRYLNHKKVAREAHIPPDALADLRKSIREQFPTDDMMCQLRILRARMAVRDRYAKLEDILPQQPAVVASR